MAEQRIDHLIDGRRVTSPRYFDTLDPATQTVLAEVAAGGEAEVEQAVQAAHAAFPTWAGLPAVEMARIVLDAVAVAQLLDHFEVLHGAHFQALGREQIARRPQFGQAQAQFLADVGHGAV